MAVKRLLQIRPQLDDGSGVLLSNGRLFFYAAVSSTKQNTYNSSSGSVANANPIVLNARGEIPGEVWGTVGQTYKIGLAIAGSDDPPASFIWSEDNVACINDITSAIDEWIAGPAPTFIAATSFSLVGDQTTEFHIGRRLKTINSGGTVYSTITNAAFAVVSTITVENDASTLDAGLSAVSLGIIRQSNTSEPAQIDNAPVVVNRGDRTKRQRLSAANLTAGATRVLTLQDADISLGNITIPAKGRLTLTTGTPVTAADVTGATTVFYTPYQGNTIQLYDGTDWNTHKFTELSQLTTDATKSPAAVANSSNYDIFVWIDSGTLRATRGPLWSSDTARGAGAGTTELEFFEGRLVNKVAITNGPGVRKGHYVGTVRSNASAQINDSLALRGVWNNYNRVSRTGQSTSSGTTASSSYGEINSAGRVQFIVGIVEESYNFDIVADVTHNAANGYVFTAVGLDSTSVVTGQAVTTWISSAGNPLPGVARTHSYPSIGFHFATLLGKLNVAGTATWNSFTVTCVTNG